MSCLVICPWGGTFCLIYFSSKGLLYYFRNVLRHGHNCTIFQNSLLDAYWLYNFFGPLNDFNYLLDALNLSDCDIKGYSENNDTFERCHCSKRSSTLIRTENSSIKFIHHWILRN